MMIKRKVCPCCGYYTVEIDEEAIVDICPVCYWQYDASEHRFPDIAIGPNHVSLNNARKNYKAYGACYQRFFLYTRRPLPEELPENQIHDK